MIQCRLCRSCENTINIFDSSLDKLERCKLISYIFFATGIHIKENDIVPKMVCKNCCENVENIFKFRMYVTLKNTQNDTQRAANQNKSSDPCVGVRSVHKPHISVVNLLKKYPNVKLPKSVLQSHIAPVITLDNREATLWLQKHIDVIKNNENTDGEVEDQNSSPKCLKQLESNANTFRKKLNARATTTTKPKFRKRLASDYKIADEFIPVKKKRIYYNKNGIAPSEKLELPQILPTDIIEHKLLLASSLELLPTLDHGSSDISDSENRAAPYCCTSISKRAEPSALSSEPQTEDSHSVTLELFEKQQAISNVNPTWTINKLIEATKTIADLKEVGEELSLLSNKSIPVSLNGTPQNNGFRSDVSSLLTENNTSYCSNISSTKVSPTDINIGQLVNRNESSATASSHSACMYTSKHSKLGRTDNQDNSRTTVDLRQTHGGIKEPIGISNMPPNCYLKSGPLYTTVFNPVRTQPATQATSLPSKPLQFLSNSNVTTLPTNKVKFPISNNIVISSDRYKPITRQAPIPSTPTVLGYPHSSLNVQQNAEYLSTLNSARLPSNNSYSTSVQYEKNPMMPLENIQQSYNIVIRQSDLSHDTATNTTVYLPSTPAHFTKNVEYKCTTAPGANYDFKYMRNKSPGTPIVHNSRSHILSRNLNDTQNASTSFPNATQTLAKEFLNTLQVKDQTSSYKFPEVMPFPEEEFIQTSFLQDSEKLNFLYKDENLQMSRKLMNTPNCIKYASSPRNSKNPYSATQDLLTQQFSTLTNSSTPDNVRSSLASPVTYEQALQTFNLKLLGCADESTDAKCSYLRLKDIKDLR